MNYELVKIVQTTNGEIAYLFDKTNGKVLRTVVQDMVAGIVPQREIYRAPQVDAAYDPIPPPTTPNTIVKRPSIVPPSIDALMREPGTPGEAIESRRV